jgi:hypothetical protein
MLRREGESVPSEQRMDVQLGGLMVTHGKIRGMALRDGHADGLGPL